MVVQNLREQQRVLWKTRMWGELLDLQDETVLQRFEGEAFILLLANNGWFIQLKLADKS